MSGDHVVHHVHTDEKAERLVPSGEKVSLEQLAAVAQTTAERELVDALVTHRNAGRLKLVIGTRTVDMLDRLEARARKRLTASSD